MSRGNWPTEPSSNAVVIYMTYHIYSRDVSDTEALRATYGGYGVLRSPAFMRDALGIAETAGGWQNPLPERFINFPYPPTLVHRSLLDGHWLAPIGNQTAHSYVFPNMSGEPDTPYAWPPNVADNYFDYNFDWVEWPGHPSVPIWGAGPKVVWIWSGMFLAFGGKSVVEDPPPAVFQPIKTKRFMAGFELMGAGTGLTTGPEGYTTIDIAESYSRDASRTPDGIGLAIRDGSGEGAQIPWDLFTSPVVNPSNAWERFYIRVRKYPSANNGIWAATAGAETCELQITTAGFVQFFTRDNFGTIAGPHFTSTEALPLNQWVRVDLYLVSRSVPNPGNKGTGTVTLYFGGTEVGTGTGDINIGFGPIVVSWTQTRIGEQVLTAGAVTYEADFDDWDNKNPGHADDAVTPGENFPDTIEWFFGTHCQQIRPTAEITNDYTGVWQILIQNPAWQALASLQSITAGARIEISTEMDGSESNSVISILRQLGCLSLIVGTVNDRQTNTGTNGTIGANFAGGADNPKTLTSEVTNLRGYAHLINVSAGLTDIKPFDEVEPTNIFKTHSTETGQDQIKLLQILAQFMGSFGPEDEAESGALGLTDVLGIHNAPYLTSWLSREEPPPVNAAGVHSGTYVGNSSLTTLTIELLGVHWLWIRNTATGQQTAWWSSMLGPHEGPDEHEIVPSVVKFEVDPLTGFTTITIVGASVFNNLTGVTYQYVAISDPLSTHMLNGAFKHQIGGPFDNLMFDPSFLPEAAFMMLETQESTAGGTGAFWKGPGVTLDDVIEFSALSPVDGAEFVAGNIKSEGALHSNISGLAFSACRSDDGSGALPFAIIQYTGNGVSPRNIAVNLRGRRPLFAIVKPLNAAGWMRDPSHTGGNSTHALSTTSGTSAITGGGVDLITVGATLNSNGIVYSVFIIPACTADAGNDGWGIDGICALTIGGWDPDALPPFLLTPPPIPADVSEIGEGGLILSGDPATLLIEDMSGIYTLVPGKTDDTVYDRQTGQTSVDLPIPDPTAKTGFV